MSLTTIVGALLAVVARPKTEDDADQKIEALRRSHARLVDHIERLERELSMTQSLLRHWRGEAARLAQANRERREQSSQALYAQYHSALAREMIRQQALSQAQQAQQSVYQGFCNCVPSRSQVWGAQHGLVQQLNDNGSA